MYDHPFYPHLSSRHPNWNLNDIQGAIIRLMEYKFVKVPCDSGDSIILVVEDFEHVGSDGSPAFGDPRYVACNPGIITAIQRPAPPSPGKRAGGSGYDYSFTQSLDPSDLLFLEATCTQTLQKQSKSFPQVVRDADWRIPVDQEAILAKVELLRVAEYGYSDVELSEEESGEEESAVKKVKEEGESQPVRVVFPLTQSQETTETAHTQFPVPVPMTQTPLTQAPMTQPSLSQPSEQSQQSQQSQMSDPSLLYKLLSLGKSLITSKGTPKKPTQRSPERSTVVFPETQVIASPVRVVETAADGSESPVKSLNVNNSGTPVKSQGTQVSEDIGPSSPISTPIKPQILQAQIPQTQAQLLPSESILEFPDYSSW